MADDDDFFREWLRYSREFDEDSEDDGERIDCGGCGDSWNVFDSDANDPDAYCSRECEIDDTGPY